MAMEDPEFGYNNGGDWFADNVPPPDYNPYLDPSYYTSAGQTAPNDQGGGYASAPAIDTATGTYQPGWNQGSDGLWRFEEPAPSQPSASNETPSFSAPQFSGQAPSQPNLNDFKSPDPLAPWTEQFNAPTAADATNSPGFKFRLDEGLKGLQRSAAAKGTLLTGGTLKNLNDYAQNSASQEYENVYNRAFNEYDTRRQNFLNNEANRYNSQRSNLNDQWGINSDYFNMGRVNRLDDFNIFNTDRAFDYGVYNDDRNFSRGLSNDYWSQALQLASLGRPPAPNI